jgi:hypothetical protein
MKIHPMGTVLFDADSRTDMTNVQLKKKAILKSLDATSLILYHQRHVLNL